MAGKSFDSLLFEEDNWEACKTTCLWIQSNPWLFEWENDITRFQTVLGNFRLSPGFSGWNGACWTIVALKTIENPRIPLSGCTSRWHPLSRSGSALRSLFSPQRKVAGRRSRGCGGVAAEAGQNLRCGRWRFINTTHWWFKHPPLLYLYRMSLWSFMECS